VVADHAEQSLQIGAEIVVAGNSEGEGVVREIPGKLVGLGPDRIEVDAEFVPGNSGSPILLKSTGQVIGVATYMKIPRSLRGSTKSVTSLNEVRRFGYRMDTIANWIKPATPERIMREGQKLVELEQTMSVVVSILNAGTSNLNRFGSEAFVSKERIAANPGLASLAAAVDAFTAASRTAKDSEEGKKNVLGLFDALKAATVNDMKGYRMEHFSGYFADQFKEEFERRKGLYEWLDTTAAAVSKNASFISEAANEGTVPPVDVAKLNFQLKEEIYTLTNGQKGKRVVYPLETKPGNLANIFWVDEGPNKEPRVIQMHSNILKLTATDGGLHKIHVEYRTAGMIKTVSNLVEVDLATVPSSKPSNSTPPPAKPSGS
jgi:hypothetical protein